MPIQIGTEQPATFEQPLELLSDCHRRLEHFLEILIKVTETCHGKALDDEHREALALALKYFRDAAPHHTADEEDSLFPRLREAGGEVTRGLFDKMDSRIREIRGNDNPRILCVDSDYCPLITRDSANR